MYRDPIVEEIHRIREEHTAKFNYDLHAIYLDIKQREKEARKRGVKFVKPKPRRAALASQSRTSRTTRKKST